MSSASGAPRHPRTAKGIAHHGVAFFQQVRPQVGAAVHHVLAYGGDIDGAELVGEEGRLAIEDRRNIRIGQFEIRQARTQAGTACGDGLGAEEGGQAAGEVVLAAVGMIQHKAGRAALRPTQGKLVRDQLVGAQLGIG